MKRYVMQKEGKDKYLIPYQENFPNLSKNRIRNQEQGIRNVSICKTIWEMRIGTQRVAKSIFNEIPKLNIKMNIST